MSVNKSSKRNKTIRLTDVEIADLEQSLLIAGHNLSVDEITDKLILGDILDAAKYFPRSFANLLFLDPPYNRYKTFNENAFSKMTHQQYAEYLDSFIPMLIPALRSNASVYVCGDWSSSASIITVLEKYFIVRNRITWEREKGRGSKRNWKNNTEDIWYCTLSKDYTFNFEAVKLRRRVVAPYRVNGAPKDWDEAKSGNFRLTFSSNIWTDISVPFWSMPENTEHPTQKPEKLLAKIILASTNEGDFVLDPFAGSGTTPVTAKKLKRKFVGVELDKKFACLAARRLQLAEEDKRIQGYEDGVFWERNSLNNRTKIK